MAYSYDECVELVEMGGLPKEVSDAAVDALGFTQAFHDFMHDWSMLKDDAEDGRVDVGELEKAFESFIGEFQAACIFLASLPNSDKHLQAQYTALTKSVGPEVPSLVVVGYKRLAERVRRTRKSLGE